MKYVSVPTEVEAVQWDGVVLVGGKPDWLIVHIDRGCDVPSSVADPGCAIECGSELLVGTFEGTVHAGARDWIVRQPDGSLSVMSDPVFCNRYRQVGVHPNAVRYGSDAEMLKGVGTDAVQWARAFLGQDFAPDSIDEELLTGWFANAIEAGRSAGQAMQDEGDLYGVESHDYSAGYREGRADERLFGQRRLDVLAVASRGCDGWGIDQITQRAEQLLAWVHPKPEPEPEPVQYPRVDEFGHPHGTVFIPPVGDGLVEHAPAEPPAPVAGDARSEESLRTTEELASGNAHERSD